MSDEGFKGWPWQTYDPVLGWKNKPDYDAHGLRTNALGFKGVAPPRCPKPVGMFRIVSVGDSGTFGIWQAGPGGAFRFDGYPDHLDALIRRRALTNVEVVNAGVLGYTAAHGLRQLVTALLPLQPDIVTVRFGFNDHGLAWNRALRALEPRTAVGRRLWYRGARWGWTHPIRRCYHTVGGAFRKPLQVRWLSPDEFARHCGRFVELGERHGFRTIFLDYPLRPIRATGPTVVEPPYDLLGVDGIEELYELHESYQQLLRRVAAGKGAAMISTMQTVCGLVDGGFSPYDMVHLNSNGAAAVAASIFDALAAEWPECDDRVIGGGR